MQPAPAAPGQSFAAIDTPALVVDLDAFERNLDRMAAFAAQAGVRVRPHAKTHKSPVIAGMQVARGAVGVCCQKVSEAEIMVDGGIADVLVSNEVVGAHKLARLARLARRARIGICIDAAASIPELEAAAAAADSLLHVLVEIDVGGKRCGIAPGGAAAELARDIATCPHLRFDGVQAYHGSAQHFRTPAERGDAIAQAVRAVQQTQQALAQYNLVARTIAGAGTGTFEIEAASGVYNELQPGSYIFLDADYARNAGDGAPAAVFEHALFVVATIMSAPVPDRRVLDAGHKCCAVDSGMPTVWQRPDLAYHRPSDEHGVLDLSRATAPGPEWGERVLLVPSHCDPTVNLHDWYVGVRGLGTADARVESVWPVAARGALF